MEDLKIRRLFWILNFHPSWNQGKMFLGNSRCISVVSWHCELNGKHLATVHRLLESTNRQPEMAGFVPRKNHWNSEKVWLAQPPKKSGFSELLFSTSKIGYIYRQSKGKVTCVFIFVSKPWKNTQTTTNSKCLFFKIMLLQRSLPFQYQNYKHISLHSSTLVSPSYHWPTMENSQHVFPPHLSKKWRWSRWWLNLKVYMAFQ